MTLSVSIVYCLLFILAPVASVFFFLMIRRPPRSTLDRSSAASDVYKRQTQHDAPHLRQHTHAGLPMRQLRGALRRGGDGSEAVSYTHLRAHETVLDLVCRLLLEKKKTTCQLHLPSSSK